MTLCWLPTTSATLLYLSGSSCYIGNPSCCILATSANLTNNFWGSSGPPAGSASFLTFLLLSYHVGNPLPPFGVFSPIGNPYQHPFKILRMHLQAALTFQEPPFQLKQSMLTYRVSLPYRHPSLTFQGLPATSTLLPDLLGTPGHIDYPHPQFGGLSATSAILLNLSGPSSLNRHPPWPFWVFKPHPQSSLTFRGLRPTSESLPSTVWPLLVTATSSHHFGVFLLHRYSSSTFRGLLATSLPPPQSSSTFQVLLATLALILDISRPTRDNQQSSLTHIDNSTFDHPP